MNARRVVGSSVAMVLALFVIHCQRRTEPVMAGAQPAKPKPSDDARVTCPPGTTQTRSRSQVVHSTTIECLDGDGSMHGPSLTWLESGAPATETHYVHGQLEGPFRGWHDNGQRSYEGTYRAGKVDGIYHKYHDNGQLEAEAEFREGKLAGKVRAFDRNGRSVRVTEPGEYFPFLYANDRTPPPREPDLPAPYQHDH